MRSVKVKAAGIEDIVQRCARFSRLNNFCLGIERADDHACRFNFMRLGGIHFIEQNYVRKFDLVDQQIDNRSMIFFAQSHVAVG